MTCAGGGRTGLVLRLFVTAAVLLLLLLALLKPADSSGAEVTETALRNAAVSYAAARLVNGAISVLKGTEVGVSLGGTVTFAVGEILDPLHDLVEQLSLVLLVALTSLGIQQVLLDIFASTLFNLALVGVGVLLLGELWLRRLGGAARALLLRLFCLVLVLRFAVVAAVLANQAVYQHFLADTWEQANHGLGVAGAELERARQSSQDSATAEPADGLLGLWAAVRESVDPTERLQAIRRAADETLQQALDLITVFVMQTLLLPLLFLALIVQAWRGLLRLISPSAT